MTVLTLSHEPVEGDEFMPSGWCGACETCTRAPLICFACSYGDDGMPDEPVMWPCPHAPAGKEEP